VHVAQSGKPYMAGWIGGLTVLAIAQLLIVLAALGHPANVVTVASLSVGGALVAVGNYLGKVRRNFFFGIRTPWTLSSDLSWDKSHRLGGWLFVVLGIAFVLAGLARSAAGFIVVLALLLALLAMVTLYSYFVWRGDPRKHPVGR
jgi:uncharacterized membrane protein